jgi:hypothetical protein
LTCRHGQAFGQITSRNVGSMLTRCRRDAEAGLDRVAGLHRIGVDQAASARG